MPNNLTASQLAARRVLLKQSNTRCWTRRLQAVAKGERPATELDERIQARIEMQACARADVAAKARVGAVALRVTAKEYAQKFKKEKKNFASTEELDAAKRRGVQVKRFRPSEYGVKFESDPKKRSHRFMSGLPYPLKAYQEK